ncbi:hypothetical protein ACIQOV_17160 [Kitasatospora sp. NPDC091257]|uniref:hypothetical protein n=1 Tax=Kitasatospora sp. NPDC091257 TaxID=3364084 RepID=UPI0038173AEA
MKRFITAAVLLAALLGISAPAALAVPQDQPTAARNVHADDTSWGGSCATPSCQPVY